MKPDLKRMHRPEVSAIIPAFNAEPFIAQSIQSVLDQSFHDFEVIVVDNRSTDRTSVIAEQFDDPRICVIKCHRQGAGAARNTGLECSSGVYVQFLDADDLLAQNKFELQLKTIKSKDPKGTVASCEWARFEDNLSSAYLAPESVWATEDPVEWIISSLGGGGMMHSGAWLVHRDLIEAAGPWDESLSLHDDGEFFTRVLLQAESQQFVSGTRVYYRNVPGGLSGKRDRNAIESAFRVCQSQDGHLLARRDDYRAREAIATQYAQFAYEFSAMGPDLSQLAMQRIQQLKVKPINNIGGLRFRRLVGLIGFHTALSLRSAVSGRK
ncbi:glycosyltransferase family 2 protein [Pseudomonadota bacterium]